MQPYHIGNRLLNGKERERDRRLRMRSTGAVGSDWCIDMYIYKGWTEIVSQVSVWESNIILWSHCSTAT